MNEKGNIKSQPQQSAGDMPNLSNKSSSKNEPKKEKEEAKKDPKEAILEKTAKEYFSSAEDECKKERYNAAVVLYFKALVSFVDLFLLRETGNAPSSHTTRFRITQEKFPEIYDLIDKDFPFCQKPPVTDWWHDGTRFQ